VSPRAVLHNDRRSIGQAFLLGALVIGFVGAGLGLVGRVRSLGVIVPVTTRSQEVVLIASLATLCGAVTLAMLVHATSAWGRFILVKFILAVRGDIPWRLMTFLEDAERVGVLRRLGPQYEFRSELFRTYLARQQRPDGVATPLLWLLT
jgi:hypothetical protein